MKLQLTAASPWLWIAFRALCLSRAALPVGKVKLNLIGLNALNLHWFSSYGSWRNTSATTNVWSVFSLLGPRTFRQVFSSQDLIGTNRWLPLLNGGVKLCLNVGMMLSLFVLAMLPLGASMTIGTDSLGPWSKCSEQHFRWLSKATLLLRRNLLEPWEALAQKVRRQCGVRELCPVLGPEVRGLCHFGDSGEVSPNFMNWDATFRDRLAPACKLKKLRNLLNASA